VVCLKRPYWHIRETGGFTACDNSPHDFYQSAWSRVSHQVLVRRLQANVMDVVAQVEKRVFNHAIGKQRIADMSTTTDQIAYITLNSDWRKYFRTGRWAGRPALCPKELKPEAGITLFSDPAAPTGN